jgi:DNA-binding response OmpR family regulator
MAEVALVTADSGGVAQVLPALALLQHHVTLAPMSTSGLAAQAEADVLLIDGRLDLVSARSLCRTAGSEGILAGAIPVLLVLTEGGFTAVSPSWGAGDLIVSTAGPAEIEARIRLLVGRTAPSTATRTGSEVESGDVLIDSEAYTARVDGRLLDLTFREFELLKHLVSHPGTVHTRAHLLQEVWGYDYFGGTRTVDVHVRRLRAKLGAEHDQLISTVRNVGYRFDPRGSEPGSSDDDGDDE